jgi:hypothetical protein
VVRNHAALKSLKTSKPTALVLYQGYEALHYANITDIMMIDKYLVPWLPLASFGQHVEMTRLALGGGKPLISVFQAFDWGSISKMLPGEKNLRPPTHEEIRCMTYEALARGATGLFYFAFDAGWKMREHPETWAALSNVVQEVNKRLPLFQAEHQWWAKEHQFGKPAHRFNAALQSSVTSCLLRVTGANAVVTTGDYILAANNAERSQQYSFALPRPSEANPKSRVQSQQPNANRPPEAAGRGRIGGRRGRAESGAGFGRRTPGPIREWQDPGRLPALRYTRLWAAADCSLRRNAIAHPVAEQLEVF